MGKRIAPHLHKSGCWAIGDGRWSYTREIVLVNPAERDYARHSYVLFFGAYGDTHLMVWTDSLEDAIEECAAWLAEHAPGHVMREWSDEHKDLIREACQERGVEWPAGFEALDDERKWEICDAAEADLTRTESGFLTSYEWGISAEDPDRADLMAMIGEA